jgi:uncharacterized protein (TIGR02588 family)
MNAKSNERPPVAGKNPLEWLVFGFSALLVIAVVAVLAQETIRWKDSPAHLRVELGEPELKEAAWWLPVKVRNDGEGLAADVQIEVNAGSETAGFTLDFVPRGTEREGRVSFPGSIDPRDARALVRGYQEP